MTAGLELRDLRLELAGRPLLGPLTLAIAPGEIVTLMGPSGCGKSSLLALICGTLDPVFTGHGHILLDGQDIGGLPPERRGIGILFQDDMLFPHMTVGENLGFAVPRNAHNRGERQALIESALGEAGLEGFSGRDPATLSGGQRARIALLRTLLSHPRALLLDEPFGKLDADLRASFSELVFGHARRRGLPTLLVTHDPIDAQAAGGRIVPF
ncbi:MAG TPA: ATP-binding cassette domain-containing protein [Dongiaceae bacterium]|jgi:putative thiamine transport system ATP-binding protein